MATGFAVRKNEYYDSVFLMGISKKVSDILGVKQNVVLMGTEANKAVFSDLGFADSLIDSAQATDLIVGVIAESQQIADAAVAKLDEFMMGGEPITQSKNPHSLKEGFRLRPNANLVAISIPGEYAAREAASALENGLNVFLFSDHVSVEEELNLKQVAASKSLIVMGPGCGTSIINGIGLGFANVVRKGSIGVIAGAGTGLQEFTCLMHNAGFGISQAIGTGGRDLSNHVGGITTLTALDVLEEDPQTEVITLISKPPGEETLDALNERLRTLTKPVIGCFFGVQQSHSGTDFAYRPAHTIDEAAGYAINLLTGTDLPVQASNPISFDTVSAERSTWNPTQKYLRGLFAGGTFSYQAQQILQDENIEVYSNAPLDPRLRLADSNRSLKHSLVDMGEDEFTAGKPHPMIDGTQRRQRILAESQDQEVAILLLDIILGYNASMDPAGELVDAIREAKHNAKKRGGKLTVVISVCGTDQDPQELNGQLSILQDNGVFVFRSSAQAVQFCATLLKGR
jgi:FdrA protein